MLDAGIPDIALEPDKTLKKVRSITKIYKNNPDVIGCYLLMIH